MVQRRSNAKAAAEVQAKLDAKFEKLEEWNGIEKDDPVRVQGIKGKRFRFVAHVTNTTTGSTWVDVIEYDVYTSEGEGAPRPMLRCIRAFDEARIIPIHKPRKRKASIASAV